MGAYRTHSDPMQVISGSLQKRKVHFEAPPSKRVPAEMKAFKIVLLQSDPWPDKGWNSSSLLRFDSPL